MSKPVLLLRPILRQVDGRGDLFSGTDVLLPPFEMDTSLAVIYFSPKKTEKPRVKKKTLVPLSGLGRRIT